MWIRILFAAVLLVLDLGGPWPPNVSLVYAQKPEVAEIDAWLVRDLQMSSQFAVADKMGYFQAEGVKVNPRWDEDRGLYREIGLEWAD